MKKVDIQGITIGANNPFALIAGPCVIEDLSSTLHIADRLREVTSLLNIPLIFKASYDKANRTSLDSYRGPGIKEGLNILKEVKKRSTLPLLTDVHCREDVTSVAEVVDIIQIPAFLSRQTDLVIDIAKTGRIVNIKKGQFMAPWDIKNVIDKVLSTGNDRILLTERGVSFGYNNLVVDFRAFPILRSSGYPVIFDVTHSLQLPGGLGSASGGEREMVPFLAKGAVAAGIDGIFMEVHPAPDKALCDGPNSMPLDTLPSLLEQLKRIDEVVKPVIGVNVNG